MFEIYELIHSTRAHILNVGRNPFVKGISIDTRTLEPGEAFLALKGDNFDGHDYIDEALEKGANCVIVGQDAKRQFSRATMAKKLKRAHFLKVKDTRAALGQIAHFHRRKFDIPVIGVTGSNGKTTTKEMVAAVLSTQFPVLKNEGTKNNQIGVSMTLLKLNGRHRMAVLEIGTNHFGEVATLAKICLPSIGIITNIGPSHLQHFGNEAGVLKEKCALIEHLQKPRIAITNNDDALLQKRMNLLGKARPAFTFGIEKECDVRAHGIQHFGRGIRFKTNNKYWFTLNTLGYYNIYNALAAITAGGIFGIDPRDAAGALAAFDFPKSRLILKKFRHVQFIDDTYNSNPLSLTQAVGVLARFKARGRKVLVVGDMLELGSRRDFYHRQAGKEAAGACDILVTVGELSRSTAEAARCSGFDMKNIFVCNSCHEAKEVLFGVIDAGKNDVVLVKGSRLMQLEEIFNKR